MLAAIIGSIAAVASVGIGLASTITNGVQTNSELDIQRAQLQIQREQLDLEKENQALQKEQLQIQKDQLSLQQSQLDIQYEELAINKDTLQLQKDEFALQQDQYYEGLTSDYYSYMQQLSQMQGEFGQNQIAINQEQENIASNQYYLDTWADEYDLNMSSAFDEAYGAYQQQASNYGANLTVQGERGNIGSASSLTNTINMLNKKRAEKTANKYLGTTALDLISSRQTASSAIDTSYQSIGAYKDAMNTLSTSITSMEGTTTDLKNKLKDRGITV